MANAAPFRLLGLTLFAIALAQRLAPSRPLLDLVLAALAASGIAIAALGLAIPASRRRPAWTRALAVPGFAMALATAAMFEIQARNPCLSPSLHARLEGRDEGLTGLWLAQVGGIPEPDSRGTRVVFLLLGEVVRPRASRPSIIPASGSVAALLPSRQGKDIPTPGEWWMIRGTLFLEPIRRNPGGPDRRAWAERRGIGGRLVVAGPGSARRIGRCPSWRERPDLAVATVVARIRGRVHREIAARFEPEAAGLAEAMALGMRGSLDSETIAGFRHLGWQHLIAVSGMNVGFVLVLVRALLHLMRLPRFLHATTLIVVVVVYTVLTGGEPPVVRATVMLLLALLARALERQLSSGRALALAALVCLAAAPGWLADPSFQLSFGALAGMALVGPKLDWSHPLLGLDGRSWVWRGLGMPLWSGVAAQAGCLPILATTFHGLSPWGALSGPLVIPHSALLVSAVLLGLALLAFIPPLGNLCLGGAATVTEALLAGERIGWRRLSPPLPMGSPGLLVVIAFSASLLLLPLSGNGRRRLGVAAVAGGTALVMVAGWPPARGPTARTEVVFLDVGQGDAAIVLAHGEVGLLERLGCRRRPQAVVVIDVGDRRDGGSDAGSMVVAPALAALGARAVDLVILSHADRDHVGGLEGLARVFPVHAIVWSRPLPPIPVVNRLTGEGIPLRLASQGDTVFARPGLVAVALHPAADSTALDPAGGSGNDRSLVIRLSAAGQRVLFTGDIEKLGESILCESAQDLAADVIKVPHHGSRTSSTPLLAAAVAPRHSIVSVGARNRFGHPAPEVVERWRGVGSQVWRTDACGAVTAILDSLGVTMRATVEAMPRAAASGPAEGAPVSPAASSP